MNENFKILIIFGTKKVNRIFQIMGLPENKGDMSSESGKESSIHLAFQVNNIEEPKNNA